MVVTYHTLLVVMDRWLLVGVWVVVIALGWFMDWVGTFLMGIEQLF